MNAKSRTRLTDDLVKRCLEGDRSAEEELARACLPRVWRTVFLGCGGGPDVDDIVQTVMVRAFTHLHQYRGPDKFAAWLGRVTIRVMGEHLRKSGIKALLSHAKDPDECAHVNIVSPEKTVENRQILRRLARHIDKIGSKKRIPLVLSLVHGYSAPEIAEIVGCGEEAAKKRLLRGRREMVSRIRKDPYCKQILEEMGR